MVPDLAFSQACLEHQSNSCMVELSELHFTDMTSHCYSCFGLHCHYPHVWQNMHLHIVLVCHFYFIVSINSICEDFLLLKACIPALASIFYLKIYLFERQRDSVPPSISMSSFTSWPQKPEQGQGKARSRDHHPGFHVSGSNSRIWAIRASTWLALMPSAHVGTSSCPECSTSDLSPC